MCLQAALLLKRQQNSVPEDELDLGGDNSMADLIGDALNLEKLVHVLSVTCFGVASTTSSVMISNMSMMDVLFFLSLADLICDALS